ncbi:DUF5617 domain-containing protein [Legionella sp. CNM-4043-24]|uniref:DUF5617 domain-containing protein n=1 Tax=Legionella sp. CNM-4043-24 TaxID=3421646 RepID=UPI00403ABBD8
MFTRNDSDSDLSNVDLEQDADVTENEEVFVFTQEHFNNAWFYGVKHYNTQNASVSPEPSYESRYLSIFPRNLRSRASEILAAACQAAESEQNEDLKSAAFREDFITALNNAFGTAYRNTLYRPLEGENFVTATGRIRNVFDSASVLDLSEVRFIIRAFDDEKLKTLLRSIPPHIDTVDLSGCLDFPRDDNRLIRILSHLPPTVRTVTLNDNWHNTLITHYTAKTAQQIAHIAGHLPLTVKNINITFPEGQKHHQGLIESTRRAFLDQRRLQFPASYQGIYRTHSHQDELLQAKALLNDYAKGNNPLFLFFTCHAGRSKTREVAALVRRINNPQSVDNITTMEQLLVELKRIDPENRNGSLARRTSFIEDQYAARRESAAVEPGLIAVTPGGF